MKNNEKYLIERLLNTIKLEGFSLGIMKETTQVKCSQMLIKSI
jgi:hypothetical protein